jgi:ABC-type tungstate transport system substrate-binding protein
MNIGAPELLIILAVLGIPAVIVGLLVWIRLSRRKRDTR